MIQGPGKRTRDGESEKQRRWGVSVFVVIVVVDAE